MVIVLLNAVAQASVGQDLPTNFPNRTYQATVEGEGAVSATLVVEHSNDRKVWFPLDNALGLDVAGNDKASAMFSLVNAGYGWVRASCTAISGTNAKASVTMGMM